MKDPMITLSYEWWIKLTPLCKKFARQTHLSGYNEEDLMQECYLQLVKCLQKFDSTLGVPFESYYKIHLYGWRANQNRKKTEYLSLIDETDDAITTQPDLNVNIELQVQNKFLLKQITEAIGHLQTIEQTLIIDYYLQNKPLKEIAKGMNLKYKAAEFKKSKALKELRRILKDCH